MTKLIALITIVIFSVTEIYGQTDKYLFERKDKESATNFVERYFADYCAKSHQILEEYWGDESKGKKIMAFFSCPIRNESYSGSVVVFQPVGDRKNYLVMSLDLDQVGAFKDEIISVFFLDVNNDGIKELFVLRKGEMRSFTTLEDIDENGVKTEHETMVCCVDTYYTDIIEQIKNLNDEFLPVIKNLPIQNNFNLEELKTADEVKTWLKEYLKEKSKD